MKQTRQNFFCIIPDEKAKGRDKSYNKAADKDIIEKKKREKKEKGEQVVHTICKFYLRIY